MTAVGWCSSVAETLPTDGDNNGPTVGDVFLYDRLTNTTKVLTDNAHIPSRPTGENYSGFSISADGNMAVFKGQYTVTDPQFGPQEFSDIYVYNRTTDTVHLLANPANNNTPYNVMDEPHIGGGGHVVFSDQDFGNLQGPPVNHVYVTDTAGRIQTDLTLSAFGLSNDPQNPNVQYQMQQPMISDNGRYLTLWLTQEQSDQNTGSVTSIGPSTLYTYDRMANTVQTIASTASSERSGRPR